MSALPNPLQELAAQARKHVYVKTGIQLSEECALAVGTLLQAERAATLEPIVNALKTIHTLDANAAFVTIDTVEFDGFVRLIKMLATSAAASALSAVVQRETEKLREFLREAAQDRHDLTQKWEGKYGPKGSRTACDSDGFDTCPAVLCVKVRAALQ